MRNGPQQQHNGWKCRRSRHGKSLLTVRGKERRRRERCRGAEKKDISQFSASALAEDIIEQDDVVTAHAIPVSDISNRLLLGQFDLNQTFPKTYANPNPVTNPPVQHMSINSAFHGIHAVHIFSLHYPWQPFSSQPFYACPFVQRLLRQLLA